MKGFVDLQVNGFSGVDFSAPGLSLEDVRRVVEVLRRRGTIAFCPTVITSSLDTYQQNLPVLAAAMEQPDLRPHLLGIHLEGPFISPEEGARGAHSARHTRPPDLRFSEHLRELAGDRIGLVTLAPELPGAEELIRHLVSSGITVSLGHHLADRDTIARACQWGAKGATHLGNGLPNWLPRHPNPIWDQLDQEDLTVMLITDGHHLPPSFIRVVARLVGAGRLIVVSDSAPVAGLAPGSYRTLGQDVVLDPSGRLWNPVEDHLVGSSRCLLECMNHLAELDVLGPEELWKVGYENPLTLIGRQLDEASFSSLPDLAFQEGSFTWRPDLRRP